MAVKKLLKDENNLRILTALEQEPMLYSQIQSLLKLDPTRLDRSLEFLRKGFWIIPRTIPAEGNRILARYELTWQSKNLLDFLLI